MTRQEVIDAFKTELSKTYIIRITDYKNGEVISTKDKSIPNKVLSFDREVIDVALELLEGQYDI